MAKKLTYARVRFSEENCDRLFDAMMARAVEVAEEQYRRIVFDNEMAPEVAEQFRPIVVARTVERTLEQWIVDLGGKEQPND